MSRHRLFDPEGLPTAVGFSYGCLPAAGRTLYLAGMTGERADGTFGEGIDVQFADACRAVARVVGEAGGSVTDVVATTIYTTELANYRAHLGPIGEAYREVFGRHYPPTALIGVAGLFNPLALVELVCVAVLPEG